MLVGFFDKYLELKKISKRLSFAFDYRDKFIQLINDFTSTNKITSELYIELTEKVAKMQSDLGAFGLVSVIDKLREVKMDNQQFLVNFLPEIREMANWSGNTIMQQRFMQSANTCDDILLRYIGDLKEQTASKRKNLFNPFSCLAQGVMWIVWLPANILLMCGFIPLRIAFRIKNSIIVKFITILITIIGLLSSIVTVVIGWDQFLLILKSWGIK